MKLNKLPLALLLALLVGFAGCGGDDDDDDSNNPPPPAGSTGSVTGIVSAAGGGELEGVAVTIGAGAPAQTNEDGYFVLANVPAGEVVVSFMRDGYVANHQNAVVLANQTTHLPEVALLTAQSAVVQADAGGTVDAGPAEVTFPADAFVDAGGTPYSGEVHVEVAAMQPQAEDFYAAFPGDFEGVRENGTTVPFVSFGFMDVRIMNADKSAPLRLAPGVTAELRMETIDKAPGPDTMPMWYYDPETGRWIEDGTATLDGNVYVADVEHFTTWNWDLPLEDVCLIEGTVLDLAENPVANARVISQGVQTAIMDEAYTDADGHFSVRGIVEQNFRVRAIKGSYATPVVDCYLAECPFTLTASLELLEPAYTITLTWGAAPSDLDSHLLIPATWTAEPEDFYRVYYSNMGSLTDHPYAVLDTDDTSSYGPEVISGFEQYEGRMGYYVHNYSGNGSHPLKQSGAVVNLMIGDQVRTYEVADVPAEDTIGTWHVFDIVVGGQGFTIEDVMAFETWNDKAPLPAKR